MKYSDYLEQLPFIRESFYGLGLSWYGFDSLGNIAMFEGGNLPIPSNIFLDKTKYLEMYEFFEKIPEITTARIVKRFTRMKTFSGKIADYTDCLKIAQKGVFFIEEQESIKDKIEVLNGYYLVAIPDEKLHLSNLPERIQNLIQPYYFPIDFSEIEEVEKIDVTKYLFC